MEEEAGFDSVQWDRDHMPESPSEPEFLTSAAAAHGEANRRRPSSGAEDGPQAGPNADRIDLAGIGQDGQLHCEVGSPQKESEGTKDAFISYKITTTSDFSTFQRPTFSVRRRFNDFLFLRNALYKEYQAAAVPPLPEKNNVAYVRGDRFSTEFTQRRAWSLHRFITRITQHPILRRSAIFLLFLETRDWNDQMRNRPHRSNTVNEASAAAVQPQGFFDNVADTMLNAFTKVHKPDARFIGVSERLSKLDEDLNHVEKIVSRVVRRQSDLESDYADLAVNMRKLTPLEPAIEAPVQMFSGCVEETSRGWKSIKDHTDQNYLGSLRDMDAYIVSVKTLLRTREQKQLDYEGLTEYLSRASLERDTLASHAAYGHSGNSLNPATFIRNKVEDMRGVDHETARRERSRKLDVRIEELNREVDISKSTSEMFDQQVMKEVDDFERIKGLEFRDTLGELAGRNIEFYKGVIGTWERFLSEMDEGDQVLKGKGTVA